MAAKSNLEWIGRLKLGVNVDHVATLREARYRSQPAALQAEPSVLEAVRLALAAGADSITMHLREDRRHVQDRDVWAVRAEADTLLNLEMGNAAEIVEIALKLRPDFACLVPEKRQEVTTEGGLDVLGNHADLAPTVKALEGQGTRVSLFIDPIAEQVLAAAEIGASMIELHTGTFANSVGAERAAEVARLVAAAELAHGLGLVVNAGHGLTTGNLTDLFPVPHLHELNIGHHLISRSVSIGLGAAVKEMLGVMAGYPHGAS